VSHDEILSARDVTTLARIVEVAGRGQLVTWLDDERDGEPRTGTARALTDERGNHWHGDVRDAHLWVTTRSGMEAFLPVGKVVALSQAGSFAFDYDGGGR
jgi:hypothetical protein